tara:strand:+ start:58 stop:549 length:492 start_codon:yes stop_codon:yes gene_type:complete
MARYDYTHFDMENPGYGHTGEAAMDINAARVNMAKYKGASKAARAYAGRKGISKVKTTKALSETARALVDNEYGMDRKQAQTNISKSLTGLTKRLAEGDRSGRFERGYGGNWSTAKGGTIGEFGQHLATQLGYGDKPVMRPKLPKGTVVKGAKTAASIISKLR